MYDRTLSRTIHEVDRTFPVLLLTGPRQVGKTTLLEMCASGDRNFVTLDDLRTRKLAREDPPAFMQAHPPPLAIDEIQYAPELFSYIKIAVDREKRNGMYWLTGSQKFHLMKGVTESLAGRVAIIDLLGLSQAELDGRAGQVEPFMPTSGWIEGARGDAAAGAAPSTSEIFGRIWRGSFPALHTDGAPDRGRFFDSYIQTYIQRDVRDILKVSDETSFHSFLTAVAARTGQLLNYADLARDVDIAKQTAKSWMSVLEASGLVHLLRPYHRNIGKRLVTKTPKSYFLDTGLCAHLTRWPDAASLEAGTMAGPILETYVFTEILKSYWHTGRTPYFYFYRDTDQKEVDLVIEAGDYLHPVEFKKTASPSRSAHGQFRLLGKLGKQVGHGAVVCFVERDMPLAADVTAVPVGYL